MSSPSGRVTSGGCDEDHEQADDIRFGSGGHICDVESSPAHSSKEKAGRGPMGRGMMNGGMMMNQMMAKHEEVSGLMNKMMQSVKALNNEKDPAKLRDLLKEHSALMDQMHAKMMGEGTMVQNMATHMKNCPIVSSNTGENGKFDSK